MTGPTPAPTPTHNIVKIATYHFFSASKQLELAKSNMEGCGNNTAIFVLNCDNVNSTTKGGLYLLDESIRQGQTDIE
jgi:hypothetical protein